VNSFAYGDKFQYYRMLHIQNARKVSQTRDDKVLFVSKNYSYNYNLRQCMRLRISACLMRYSEELLGKFLKSMSQYFVSVPVMCEIYFCTHHLKIPVHKSQMTRDTEIWVATRFLNCCVCGLGCCSIILSEQTVSFLNFQKTNELSDQQPVTFGI
jgi:hypothetical protein